MWSNYKFKLKASVTRMTWRFRGNLRSKTLEESLRTINCRIFNANKITTCQKSFKV